MSERDAGKDLALCEAATPGPWEAKKDRDGDITIFDSLGGAVAFVGRYGDDDAALLIASREALPYYIHRTLELQAEVERLRAASEESALARLRAWVQKREGICAAQIIAYQDCERLKLFELDPSTKSVFVYSKPVNLQNENTIGIGTEDKPASLAEMIDAALARWRELYGELYPDQ